MPPIPIVAYNCVGTTKPTSAFDEVSSSERIRATSKQNRNRPRDGRMKDSSVVSPGGSRKKSDLVRRHKSIAVYDSTTSCDTFSPLKILSPKFTGGNPSRNLSSTSNEIPRNHKNTKIKEKSKPKGINLSPLTQMLNEIRLSLTTNQYETEKQHDSQNRTNESKSTSCSSSQSFESKDGGQEISYFISSSPKKGLPLESPPKSPRPKTSAENRTGLARPQSRRNKSKTPISPRKADYPRDPLATAKSKRNTPTTPSPQQRQRRRMTHSHAVFPPSPSLMSPKPQRRRKSIPESVSMASTKGSTSPQRNVRRYKSTSSSVDPPSQRTVAFKVSSGTKMEQNVKLSNDVSSPKRNIRRSKSMPTSEIASVYQKPLKSCIKDKPKYTRRPPQSLSYQQNGDIWAALDNGIFKEDGSRSCEKPEQNDLWAALQSCAFAEEDDDCSVAVEESPKDLWAALRNGAFTEDSDDSSSLEAYEEDNEDDQAVLLDASFVDAMSDSYRVLLKEEEERVDSTVVHAPPISSALLSSSPQCQEFHQPNPTSGIIQDSVHNDSGSIKKCGHLDDSDGMKDGSMHDSRPGDACTACGFEARYVPEGMVRCLRCKKAYYCSVDCLQWDFTSGDHQLVCKEVSSEE